MNLSTLRLFCQVADTAGLCAINLTIKGKSSYTISFTATRSDYPLIAKMCEDAGWTFHTSRDEFISRELDRYQINLDRERVLHSKKEAHYEKKAS